MRRFAPLLAVCACRSEPQAPKQQATPAVAPIARAPDAAPAPAPDAAPALPVCSDGGEGLAGASITRDEVRFCLDEHDRETCWAFALAGGAMRPIATTALAAGDPSAVAVAADDPDAPPPDKPWTTKVTDGAIEICAAAGCAPFAVVPGTPPDADGAVVNDAEVSATGRLVAVARGIPGVAKKMTVEIYDRASGKRLAIARPPAMCTTLEGFANETAVVQEWDCANQGGNRLLIAPTGKVLARIEHWYSPRDDFAQIDGTRWAFAGRGDGSIEIYDVSTGARIGGRALAQFSRVATGLGRAYAFEVPKARVYVFGADGKELAQARVPTCRYEWETESVGPLHLLIPTPEAARAIGMPSRKTKPDRDRGFASTWTYASGVTLEVRPNYVSDATGEPVPPYLVVGLAIRAPSKLRVHGIGIGSTLDELERAFGAHRVAAQSSATQLVAGNDDEGTGIVFELADGKVARIAMGELPE